MSTVATGSMPERLSGPKCSVCRFLEGTWKVPGALIKTEKQTQKKENKISVGASSRSLKSDLRRNFTFEESYVFHSKRFRIKVSSHMTCTRVHLNMTADIANVNNDSGIATQDALLPFPRRAVRFVWCFEISDMRGRKSCLNVCITSNRGLSCKARWQNFVASLLLSKTFG